MASLIGHADENMEGFVCGMRSEVCCNCDTGYMERTIRK